MLVAYIKKTTLAELLNVYFHDKSLDFSQLRDIDYTLALENIAHDDRVAPKFLSLSYQDKERALHVVAYLIEQNIMEVAQEQI